MCYVRFNKRGRPPPSDDKREKDGDAESPREEVPRMNIFTELGPPEPSNLLRDIPYVPTTLQEMPTYSLKAFIEVCISRSSNGRVADTTLRFGVNRTLRCLLAVAKFASVPCCIVMSAIQSAPPMPIMLCLHSQHHIPNAGSSELHQGIPFV